MKAAKATAKGDVDLALPIEPEELLADVRSLLRIDPAKITRRERAESAKRKVEALGWIAALAAAVSHEINNPLMCVMGNLQLLQATDGLDGYGRARLEAALVAAAEITEKVRRLARVTRLEIAADGPTLPPMLDLVKSSRGLADAGALNGRRHPA